MKITLVSPTLLHGGSERVMSILANSFCNQGYEVHLCLLAKSKDFFKVDSKVQIYRFGFENKGRFAKLKSEFSTFWKFRKYLVLERPDVVLSFQTKINVFTILASRFLGLRVFISDRSNPRKKLPFVIHHLKKVTYKYATGIVAQTSLAKDILEKATKNKNVKVIANPLKTMDVDTCVVKEKVILNVGRLVKEKGQKYLIEAFDKMPQNDWKLVILGDGELREELAKQAQSITKKKEVYMPGAVNNVDEWLAKASIFAFSSISEGFPNALVEAMAAGLPCVSFDCDAGPSDLIDYRINGILIKSEDVLGLTEALNELCSDLKLRLALGEQASKVKEIYNTEKIVKKYLDFFNAQNEFL